MRRTSHALVLACSLASIVCELETGSVLELTEGNFYEYLQDYENPLDYFVMFYAPWCGHCQKLKPLWDEMAAIFNRPRLHPHIAKVDCTKETELCFKHSVKGYPTLLYFRYQEPGVGHRYSGVRTLEHITTFITEKQQPIQKNEAVNIEQGLFQLTDDNFQAFASTGDVFIKFFAPWCGHCKNMAPAWQQLARTYQHHEAVRISEVDCTSNNRICGEHDIKGYPTLLYIRNGRLVEKYSGERDFNSLASFVEMNLRQRDSASDAVQDYESVEYADKALPEKTPVETLDEENFDLILNSYTYVFVKFFTPWCGHCKRMAPAWLELGENMMSYHNVLIAEVDCTEESQLCGKQKIAGYPTLRLFKNNVHEDYEGERSSHSLQAFLSSHLVKDEL